MTKSGESVVAAKAATNNILFILFMSIIINSRKLSFIITQNSAFYCARMLIANPPPATELNFKTDLLITVFLV